MAAHTAAQSPRDPNTLSNYHEFITTHTTANFKIDFKSKSLSGNVALSFKSLTDSNARAIVLDTSHLDVQGVWVDRQATPWNLSSRSEPYGNALSIDLGSGVSYGETVNVDISVATTAGCTALQWLTPAQTSNKKHTYMFSQCQAIHARSLFPCQDTPAVKSTFDFNLRSPLPVVASGLPTGSSNFEPGQHGEPGTLLYTFRQDIPIPSYLFAVASGDIACASIGPRSTVWTGPDEIQAAKWELEDATENFIQAAERIVYPYAWTTYNVLVLPPSFPYGGMENPMFTFATPTIISGDRENVDVIAHELSHSWSGNLVSPVSWEHFWLNEGWTTYLERRIQAVIHGEAHRDFSAIIGWKALSDSIALFGEDHEYTKLVVNLKEKDPDDAFSTVPYEKGYTFLSYLEKLLGREKWDGFIPHYFTKYKEKSLDSFQFKATLTDFFASDSTATKALTEVDWDSWLHASGFPPKPDFDTSLANVCYALAEKWETLTTNAEAAFKPAKDDIAKWTANQVVVFLEKVQLFERPLSGSAAQLMGSTYGFAKSKNVEVVSRYLGVALRAKDQSAYEPTATLLGQVGRMKFVRPLYRQLNNVDRPLALKTFEANKDFYHPICRQMIEKDLSGGAAS